MKTQGAGDSSELRGSKACSTTSGFSSLFMVSQNNSTSEIIGQLLKTPRYKKILQEKAEKRFPGKIDSSMLLCEDFSGSSSTITNI